MPEPDVVEFIGRHNQVFLLTHRDDGWPTGYPMVGNSRDGGVEFSTYRASAKVARVVREGHASCLVVPRDGSGDDRCLWIAGAAGIRDDTEASAARTSEPGAAGLAVPADIAAKAALRMHEGKRCLMRVEIRATRWIGWKPPTR
jgi:hypothetical protein